MFIENHNDGNDAHQPISMEDVTPDRTAPDLPGGTIQKGFGAGEEGGLQMREPKND
jgi:hypothetical protein